MKVKYWHQNEKHERQNKSRQEQIEDSEKICVFCAVLFLLLLLVVALARALGL